MFASPISAEKKNTHKDVEGERAFPSFPVQKVSHSPCRDLPAFLRPPSTKLADQDRNTEREGIAHPSTWIQSYLAGMTTVTPRRVDQQSLVNIGIEERHISKIREGKFSSKTLKKLENLTLEQQQQLKGWGIVGDTLSNLVSGAGSGLKNLNAVLGITPEQKEKLRTFGITPDKLVKVLDCYGGSTALEKLLNLTSEQEKTLNNLGVLGDKFVFIMKCDGASNNMQTLLTLTQEQEETLKELRITDDKLIRVVGHTGGAKTLRALSNLTSDQKVKLNNLDIKGDRLVRLLGHKGGFNTLQTVLALSPKEETKLNDLGLKTDALVRIAGRSGGSNSLQALLEITSEKNEELKKLGITADELLCIVGQFGGSKNLRFLLALQPEEKEKLIGMEITAKKLVCIMGHAGGAKNLQSLLDLQFEEKEKLISLGITTVEDLVCIVGQSGGSKNLKSLLDLQPEQRKKLIDMKITDKKLVCIVGQSGGSKSLKSLLDLQPEQENKLINMGITADNLVRLVGRGGANSLQAVLGLLPEQEKKLHDLGITTVGQLVYIVGHSGGANSLQAVLGLLPEQKKRLIDMEITGKNLGCILGQSGGSRSLQSLLDLQPEQEKKLINLGLTADNLVRIVQRGGGSSTLPIVLALTPEQEKKLNDFEITKDLLVNVVRTTNRAKNLRTLLDITPEQKEELDKLEITSGELVSVVEHGGDKNLKALLGHLPNLDKRYAHQAVRLLNQNDAHASFSNQYQEMIKQDRLQDGGDGQRASVIRWAVPQTPPILQVRTVDQRGSVIVARDSVIVNNMTRLHVQSEPSTTHMEVKQEPSCESHDEVCIDSHQLRKRPLIDNGAPILRKSTNPSQSAVALTEDSINSWSVIQYGAELKKALNSVSNAGKRSETKSAIAVKCKDFLKKSMEGQHAAWINSWADTAVPVDDGPLRGQSVFAKRNMKEFEVLGAYSGILHEDERSLDYAIRKEGSVPVLTYLWTTPSKKRSIDASQYANSLATINTAHLPNSSKPQETLAKHNNLDYVRFGPNYVFYVALRDIKQGEELLIDYGPSYDPFHIKEEAIDDSIS